jgi:hypothetical protein
MPRPPVDSDSVKKNIFGPGANLGLELTARIEPGFKRDRNLRCTSTQLLSRLSECNSRFIPTTDFQFSLKSSGSIADRFHVDIDYDKQREFDASNILSLYYEGDSTQRVRRVEVGNVTFAAPSSRFMTSSVPSGNYGLQSVVQLGRMRLQGIVAKQFGNVVQRREFIVGNRTTQPGEQVIGFSDRAPALLLHARPGAASRLPEHRHPRPRTARLDQCVAPGHDPADPRVPVPVAVRDAAAKHERTSISSARRSDPGPPDL